MASMLKLQLQQKNFQEINLMYVSFSGVIYFAPFYSPTSKFLAIYRSVKLIVRLIEHSPFEAIDLKSQLL
jgi:hypothetical protein